MSSPSCKAPVGYVVMFAGDIARGARAYLSHRQEQARVMKREFPDQLLRWANGLSWWGRLNVHLPDYEGDKDKLLTWWEALSPRAQYSFNAELATYCFFQFQVDIPCPIQQLYNEVRRLPLDAKVYLNLKDASKISGWTPKEDSKCVSPS